MDKIDQLLDAMEHPERYTSAEIEEMLRDPEAKETFDLLDKTKSSLTPISTPEIEAEWEAFKRTRVKRGFRLLDLFSRNVAAGIAIGIASIAAVAAVIGISVSHVYERHPEVPAAERVAVAKENVVMPDTTVVEEEDPAHIPGTIIFDNEPFETIMKRIAEYYGYDVEPSTDISKSLRLYYRWNQALPIEDIVESLNNFEQIHLTISDKTIRID